MVNVGVYHWHEKSSWCDRCIMVRDFPNLRSNRIGLRLPFIFQALHLLIPLKKGLEMGIFANGREISDVPFSKGKKRSISGGRPQIPNEIPAKSPNHFTPNRNFQIFCLNGKHPVFHVDRWAIFSPVTWCMEHFLLSMPTV